MGSFLHGKYTFTLFNSPSSVRHWENLLWHFTVQIKQLWCSELMLLVHDLVGGTAGWWWRTSWSGCWDNECPLFSLKCMLSGTVVEPVSDERNCTLWRGLSETSPCTQQISCISFASVCHFGLPHSVPSAWTHRAAHTQPSELRKKCKPGFQNNAFARSVWAANVFSEWLALMWKCMKSWTNSTSLRPFVPPSLPTCRLWLHV